MRLAGVVPIDVAAAGVPRLYRKGAFEIQRKCALESSSSLCSGWHAHICAHAHVEAFVAVTEKKKLMYGYWYTVVVTTSKDYGVVQVQQQQTS